MTVVDRDSTREIVETVEVYRALEQMFNRPVVSCTAANGDRLRRDETGQFQKIEGGGFMRVDVMVEDPEGVGMKFIYIDDLHRPLPETVITHLGALAQDSPRHIEQLICFEH